jgi:hypothetical protein
MVKEENIINLSFSFIDESFDLAQALSYTLLAEIAPDGIRLAVHDKIKNRFVAFEKYALSNKHTLIDVANLFEKTVKQSKLYSAQYTLVKCIVVNNLSTLVPEAFLEDGNEKTLLKLNVPLEWNDMVLVDNIKNAGIKNIFAIPFELKIKFETLFRNVSYSHYSSAIIDGVLSENKNQITPKLYLHLQNFNFEVVFVKGKELILYNTFNYYTPEDFIFYLLFVYEQLHLNTEIIDAVFIGDVEKNSECYQLAQKYIRNVSFGQRNDLVDMTYQMQTIPKHNYYTLLNKYHL